MSRIAPGVTAALLTLSVGGLAACRPEPLAPPNIVLIVVDCLRSDHVGAYGYERLTTRNLDALAGEGTLFRRAYAQSHWTRPSLPTILTGLYPTEHGLLDVERDADGRVLGPSLALEATTIAEELQAAGYDTAMIGEQFQLSATFNLNQGFDYYRNRGGKASQISRHFTRWLDGRDSPGRFFTYLHYLDIHWPYCPPERFRGRFDSGESSIDTCGDWRKLRTDIRSGARVLTPSEAKRLEARYDEELAATDNLIRHVFEDLRERELWDDTLVLVTSDHGEEFYERGFIGHQGGLVDALLSVPLIVKPPAGWRGEPSAEVDTIVELRSIAPTLREAAGLAPGRGGPSLVPFLLGEEVDDPPSYAVAESAIEVNVRTATHNLIFDRETESFALYDRRSEPFEATDVAADQPEVLAAMRNHFRAWLAALQPITPETSVADDATVEGLKDLGYIE